MSSQEPSIGICLSGGGARGAAHIGVLRALLEAGIRPTVVSGASAGAIVGALYAAGKSPDEMLAFIEKSNILKLISFGIPSGGFTKLTYLKERLAEVISDDNFGALRLPLYVAISNLNTGSLEIRHTGPLFDVITASCSIPLVFKPVEIDGQLYVDGGLLSNLPAEPLASQCNLLIGVNVIPIQEVPQKAVQSLVGIAARCFDLSIVANTRPSAKLCDILIEPQEVGQFNIFQFNQYTRIADMGYAAAQAKLPLIQEWLSLK